MAQISINLASLTGFSSLTAGSHSITVVAKASGYRNSDVSSAATYNKKLPTPVLVMSGDTLSISNASSFSGFAVVFDYTLESDSDGTKYTNSTSGTSFDVFDFLKNKVAKGGDYTITVKASATNFTDSDISAGVAYEYAGFTVVTPTISLSNNTITVTNSSNYSSYDATYTWYAMDPNSSSTITLTSGSNAYINMLTYVDTITDEFDTNGYCKVYVKVSTPYTVASTPSATVVYKQTTVTPTITISDQTLTVTNATSVGIVATYTLYYGSGTKVGTFTGSTCDISAYNLPAGTYSMYVVASRSNFFDSGSSSKASYTQLPKLTTPTSLSISGTTLTFTGSTGATSYEVYADGKSIGTYTA